MRIRPSAFKILAFILNLINKFFFYVNNSFFLCKKNTIRNVINICIIQLKSDMQNFYRTIMLLIVCSLTLGAFRGDFSLAGYRMFAGKHHYLK